MMKMQNDKCSFGCRENFENFAKILKSFSFFLKMMFRYLNLLLRWCRDIGEPLFLFSKKEEEEEIFNFSQNLNVTLCPRNQGQIESKAFFMFSFTYPLMIAFNELL